MEFGILGPLEVRRDAGLVPLEGVKPRALLAVLLLHANEPVSAERLALALWGEEAPRGAVRTVQVYVSRLRKSLGDPDILATTGAGYRLCVGPGELDAERFEHLLEEGRRALAAGQAEHAASMLREALSLWRGPPLAELAFEPFAQAEIARLEEQRLAAQEARIEADLAAGRHTSLVAELQRLVAASPTRERLAGQLMLALYRCGRQGDALETYHQARRALVDDIGVEPGPALRRLQDAILRQDPSLELQPAVAELPRELDAATAPPLLGRGAELAWLRERWQAARSGAGATVTVIGPHGMGKTRLAAELAGEAHRAGASVLYAAGTGPAQAALVALGRTRAATRPTMLVLDDADKAGADVLVSLDEVIPALAEVPALVLASGEDAAALARLEGRGALTLEPLATEAVRDLALLYASGHTGAQVPAEWLRDASGGVPGRAHELSSQWARRETARRVSAAAERTATGRVELHSMEAELAGGIVEFEAAHEQAALLADAQSRVICPFKGLAAFEAADAEYFFGRERLVAELIARLVGAPLLGVVGPSGSGKSSVIRAGLLPALANGMLPGSDGWGLRLMRPGEHPLRELGDALADLDGDRRSVLAVDQFEEAFTTCRDEDERTAFIAELVRVAQVRHGPRTVVLAVRADYYGRCAAYPELATLFAAHHVLVKPMQRGELCRAVERPALRAGLRVEPELAAALVADVEHEPGALPLLSTALLELWQRRDGRHLRYAAYERTGGVRGAVARLAEEAFGQLNPEQQTSARGVLLRLAGEGDAGTLVRRRVTLSEVETQHSEDVARVVAVLTERRLLTASAGTLEVAHEALLREWPRLRGWLDEDAQGRRLHRHLTDAARDWDERGRDPGDLYRGARLAAAVEWRGEHEHELNQTERAFLDAGRAAEKSELEAARSRTRRLRALALGLAVLVLVAGIAAVLAVRETRRAESERRTAVSRSLATQAISQLDRDLDLAALLGLEAYRAEPTIEARSAALTVLPHLEHAAGSLRAGTGPIWSVAFSPDGETLASTRDEGIVQLWDVGDRRPLGRPRNVSTDDDVLSVAFSPDGETVASTVEKGILLWNVGDPRPIGQLLKGHTRFFTSVAFSPDGAMLAAGDDETVRLWDVDDRRPIGGPLKGHTRSVTSVAFSPNGDTLASVGLDGTVRLWNVREQRSLGRPLRLGPVGGIAFGPDSETLAAAGADGTVRLWDIGARRPIGQPLKGHTRFVTSMAFSPNGDTLASAGADGTVRLWDARNQRPLDQPLDGHAGSVTSVAFSSDGDTLASAGEDGTVRLWNVGDPQPLDQPLAGRTRSVTNIAFSPDGRALASSSRGGALGLWNLTDPRPPRQPFTGHAGSVMSLAFTRDGDRLASVNPSGMLRLWDVGARRPLGQPLSIGPWVNSAAFGPDSGTLAAGGGDGMVRLWDVGARRPRGQPLRVGHAGILLFSPDEAMLASVGEDGKLRLWDVDARRSLGQPQKGLSGYVTSMAFSPDGDTLASADDVTLRLWDVEERRPIGQPLKGETRFVLSVAFSPDGDTLASAGDDGTVRLWDVDDRRPLGQPLKGHTRSVTSVAFSPNGDALASAGADGTVRLWDSILWSTNSRALQDRVCAAVRRSLSRAEWQEFLPGEPYHETC